MFKIEQIPLQIEIVWHKDFLEGSEYAKDIFKILNRNPDEISQYEIGIPIRFNTELKNIKYEYSKITGLILLIDKKLILDKNYALKLKKFLEENKDKFFLIPVLFEANIRSLDLGIEQLNIIKVTRDDLNEMLTDFNLADSNYEQLKKEYLINSILQKISTEIYKEDKDSLKMRLFISHTKRDGVGKNKAIELKKLIQTYTKTDVFFDVNSIEIGNGIWSEIESEIKKKETFLIAINTNEYSNSSWCRKEILCAKKNRRPILVINAVTRKQQRSFPYLGNTKVVILKENHDKLALYKIINEIYIKAISIKYKDYFMKKYIQEGDIFINSPEILDFALNTNFKEIIYYPDPSLPKEEIELFNIFGKKLITPLEKTLNSTNLKGKNVMLSISEAKNDSEYTFLVKSFISDLARYLIAFDLNILYGGSLKYENKPLNFMKQLLTVIDFYKNVEEVSSEKKIYNYLAYPLCVMLEDEEVDHMRNVEFKKFNPLNLKIDLARGYLREEYPNSKDVWSKSLKEMRENIVYESNYIIIAGGKLEGFKGEMPGVLEEVLIAIENNKPIFMLGYYGGVCKEIIDLLLGEKENSLSLKYKEKIGIFEKGIKILKNGLSEEQNKKLFELENNTQIIELILQGMSVLNKGYKEKV